MEDFSLTTVLVAALGAGGLGAFVREIFAGLSKVRNGVSARENDRRTDLVKRAERAERAEVAATERAERETRNRWSIEEYAMRLRRLLIQAGIEPPDQPQVEGTMGGNEVRDLRADTPAEGTP